MNSSEKKRLRDKIGKHLDVSGTRMPDDGATWLSDFVDDYDQKHGGHTETRTSRHTSWSSDGKYTRQETFTDTCTDDILLRHLRIPRRRRPDGSSTSETKDARAMLNWLRDRS